MVDDVGRVGVRGQQRVDDLAVVATPRRDGEARPDRLARELVAEADVRRVDLEQSPTLGLDRGRGPAGQRHVQ